ncbi:MAG TPA: hypothetical protein VGS79_11530 [Puia sp.]|nr:hypothetical protein [Puia sp.]
MYKLPKAGRPGHACLWLLFTFVFGQVSAQNYSSLWLGNGATHGTLQTPLSLGNNPNSSTQPEFNITSANNGWSLMNILGSAWGAQFNISRGDPNGMYRLISIDGATGGGSKKIIAGLRRFYSQRKWRFLLKKFEAAVKFTAKNAKK